MSLAMTYDDIGIHRNAQRDRHRTGDGLTDGLGGRMALEATRAAGPTAPSSAVPHRSTAAGQVHLLTGKLSTSYEMQERHTTAIRTRNSSANSPPVPSVGRPAIDFTGASAALSISG